MSTQSPMLQTPLVVDLYHGSADVDFHALAAHGVVAVIAKATQGSTYVDPRWSEYRDRVATVPGLRFMSYHFMTAEDPHAQVENFVRVTMGVHGRWVDIEHNPGVGGTPGFETAASFIRYLYEIHTESQIPFCYPGVYGSDLLGEYLDNPQAPVVMRNCPRWVARYGPNRPSTGYLLWQFTEAGILPGVSHGVDISTFYGGSHAETWSEFLTLMTS